MATDLSSPPFNPSKLLIPAPQKLWSNHPPYLFFHVESKSALAQTQNSGLSTDSSKPAQFLSSTKFLSLTPYSIVDSFQKPLSSIMVFVKLPFTHYWQLPYLLISKTNVHVTWNPIFFTTIWDKSFFCCQGTETVRDSSASTTWWFS